MTCRLSVPWSSGFWWHVHYTMSWCSGFWWRVHYTMSWCSGFWWRVHYTVSWRSGFWWRVTTRRHNSEDCDMKANANQRTHKRPMLARLRAIWIHFTNSHHIYRIYFYSTFQSITEHYKRFHRLMFSDKNLVCHLSHACYMSRPSHHSWYNYHIYMKNTNYGSPYAIFLYSGHNINNRLNICFILRLYAFPVYRQGLKQFLALPRLVRWN